MKHLQQQKRQYHGENDETGGKAKGWRRMDRGKRMEDGDKER